MMTSGPDDKPRFPGRAPVTPLLLACVSGPAEAALALDAGADIIDVTDPARGIPGAAQPATVAATVAAVAGRRPVSAVAADAAAAERLAGSGVAYIRIGMRAGAEAGASLPAGLAARVKLIGVLFADALPAPPVLAMLARAGFAGAMLDTRQGGDRLLARCDITGLLGFVAACRAEGLLAGLAGDVELPDVPRLLLLAPDLLAVRGRGAAPDPARLLAVRRLIPSGPAPDALPPQAAPARADRVLVDDLVLPAFIGAYAHERGTPQRVRFAVTVSLRPGSAPVQTMDGVFSYDIITDGIRLLLDSGHFAFVETLAERIAAMLLAHPRVARVMVRVEKLDAGPARVGVEIVRGSGRR